MAENILILDDDRDFNALLTDNFEIWKLKCLGACPEDLYCPFDRRIYAGGIRGYFRSRPPGSGQNIPGDRFPSGCNGSLHAELVR